MKGSMTRKFSFKIQFISFHTSLTFFLSNLFRSTVPDEAIDIIQNGDEDCDNDSVDNSCSDDDEEPNENGLGNQIKRCWVKRVLKIYSDYAYAARMLSVDPEVREDVKKAAGR